MNFFPRIQGENFLVDFIVLLECTTEISSLEGSHAIIFHLYDAASTCSLSFLVIYIGKQKLGTWEEEYGPAAIIFVR